MTMLHASGTYHASCAVTGPEVEFVTRLLIDRRGNPVLRDPSFTPIPKHFRAVP
ncbi:MAG: hypothetical protein ABIY71_07120 [Flavobacteriales bacterium]